jgi:hypothetical protein
MEEDDKATASLPRWFLAAAGNDSVPECRRHLFLSRSRRACAVLLAPALLVRPSRGLPLLFPVIDNAAFCLYNLHYHLLSMFLSVEILNNGNCFLKRLKQEEAIQAVFYPEWFPHVLPSVCSLASLSEPSERVLQSLSSP